MKLCPRCGAIWDGERWVPEPEEELRKAFGDGRREERLCPGDLRLERKQVEGVVTLEGGFLESHFEEIENLVGRVARDARRRNVAARILSSTRGEGSLVIETTDEHLAEKIGKEVEKAFKGDLEIKWQKKDTFARVKWRRD